MKDTVIRISKKKTLRLLILSVCFVLLGLWFIIDPPYTELDDHIGLACIGIIAMFFFSMMAVFYIRNLFGHRPGLETDALGLTDHTSISAGDKILWTEIADLTKVVIYKQQFAGIVLKDAKGYIARQKGAMKRMTMNFNNKNYRTPVLISANSLEISFDDLLRLLHEHMFEQEYRSTKR